MGRKQENWPRALKLAKTTLLEMMTVSYILEGERFQQQLISTVAELLLLLLRLFYHHFEPSCSCN